MKRKSDNLLGGLILAVAGLPITIVPLLYLAFCSVMSEIFGESDDIQPLVYGEPYDPAGTVE